MNTLDAVVNTPNHFKLLKFEDLQKIESNLCYYEKISFLFLLYGYENPVEGYNKMMELCNDKEKRSSTYLMEWASGTAQWQNMIREALVITKCFGILNKLGLHKHDECARFLPANNECSLYIHPMIKMLYFVCENMTSETKTLIEKVEGQNINEYLYLKNLEIHIIKWIKDGIITVGSKGDRTKNDVESTNVSRLLNALKLMNLSHLYDLLNSTQQRLNSYMEVMENTSLHDQLQINRLNLNSSNYLNNVSQAGRMRLVNDAEYLASIVASSGKKITNNNKTCCETTIEDYELDYFNMGICLIINQEEFSDIHAKIQGKKLGKREGTEKDRDRLRAVFESYGYKVIVENNLTDVGIKKIVSDNAKKISKQDCSFIVCILSHGQKGSVFGSNYVPVEIYSLVELMRCENLKDKPSILIVQACQVPPTEKAEEEPRLSLDSPMKLQDAAMPKLSDFLLYMSTVEGYASVRDPATGTWFIQELCKVLDAHGEEANVVDLITMINNNVRQIEWDGRVMIPVFHSCFSKVFRLPKRNQISSQSRQRKLW